MMKLGELLTRHRNLFLLLLLVVTLVVSGQSNRERLAAASSTVNIPVTEVLAQPSSALERYRTQRNQQTSSDMAALEALCAQAALDQKTRDAAAAQLQTIIDARQAEVAIEGALTGSSLSPCAVVISGGSLTLVTEKATITKQDAALVMTLAQAHAGISPEDVRIMTAAE